MEYFAPAVLLQHYSQLLHIQVAYTGRQPIGHVMGGGGITGVCDLGTSRLPILLSEAT